MDHNVVELFDLRDQLFCGILNTYGSFMKALMIPLSKYYTLNSLTIPWSRSASAANSSAAC
jgi:hypothetical protein